MNIRTLERISHLAAVALAILIVTGCTFQLRDNEEQSNPSASPVVTSDPLTTKLRECRSVTPAQTDVLSECRRAWAEKRRQFLGETPPAKRNSGTSRPGSSLFAAPKDESHLPSGYPPIAPSGKE